MTEKSVSKIDKEYIIKSDNNNNNFNKKIEH